MSSKAANYYLKISRLTIDKLGVKLYDKASAVVAELIANSYDADAESVIVKTPLGKQLARKVDDGFEDLNYVIEVEDDGHGMTPEEAQSYFLKVGRDRRREPGGEKSRIHGRPVMGRKGIGKLAPFGICRRIEVISRGGDKTKEGYITSHFILDYDSILEDDDREVPLERGELDRTYRNDRGTTIRLSNFLPKRVPDKETFLRQIGARFTFGDASFNIFVNDTNVDDDTLIEVNPLEIAIVPKTKIDLATRPVEIDGEEPLPVTGWLAMAKDPYKHEEMTGIRIYARGKIVAQTRDFEQPAGFTGEFAVRSYLVGEVHAEWLDLDNGEDLVRSDRQGILWDSDYGRALRAWGGDLIKEIGKLTKEPRRVKTRDKFLVKSDIEAKARERYGNSEIVSAAVDLASKIGSFAAEDELNDDEYIDGLTEVILSTAPHRALVEALQNFSAQVGTGGATTEQLVELFGKARVAEMASYSQIAAERVRTIRTLESMVSQSAVDESRFQELLSEAPWLIRPSWISITQNQQIKTFVAAFTAFYKEHYGEDLVIDYGGAGTFKNKRPDFVMANIGLKLHVVEIKARGHSYDDNDCGRMLNYIEAFDEFFDKNQSYDRAFPDGYVIDLIADKVGLKTPANKQAFRAGQNDGKIVQQSWNDFLLTAKKMHEIFLDISDEISEDAP